MPKIYISEQPFCRICGKLMDTWLWSLSKEKQAHPYCEGREFANKFIEELKNRLNTIKS